MRAPVRVADLQTREEAASFLRSAFEHQLDASIEANAQPNVGIAGDSGAKEAFNALLSPTEQRAFFQRIISDRRYWPRIKSLIGNPPYSFLRPEDDGLLRAGGICRNRINLSAQDSHVSKASDFGHGHFYDNADRTYRVINYDQKDLSLPWQNINVDKKLVVDVLLKTYTQKTKIAIFRGTHSAMNNKAVLMFPRPGQEVVLHLSKHLENHGPIEITVRIVSGRQKCAHSSIARLVVTVS